VADSEISGSDDVLEDKGTQGDLSEWDYRDFFWEYFGIALY